MFSASCCPASTTIRLEQVREAFDERLGKQQPEGAIGLVPNLAASRIANRLDLRGPAYTVDAACASSLVAVDQGVTELASGRLRRGARRRRSPLPRHHASGPCSASWAPLSRQGPSRPFDADADGMLIGEGTGIVVLKRLADAERDGDRIYAVIRGTGMSSDGRSASIFNPTAAGQVLAVRRAWADGRTRPDRPRRARPAGGARHRHPHRRRHRAAHARRGVRTAHRRRQAGDRLGEVDDRAHHAGGRHRRLIKAALAVHHGVLPPTLHCDDPRAELARPVSPRSPRRGRGRARRPRRAGVNAFGFGGINAHVVLEEHSARPAAVPPAARQPATTVTEPDAVLWLSAADPAALSSPPRRRRRDRTAS